MSKSSVEPRPDRLDPSWRADPALQRLFAALGAPAVDARAVGGCVRDAVMGRDRAETEIDLATPEPPDVVIARLEKAGVRVIPTGLAHGTVTALVDGRPFEITSLRRDTACDGRHAAVEFTTDWHEDARRRDFTFNAMSLRPDGTLFDDHGGAADAREGRVRFVGDPDDRIKEDYLRILRLFRFAALYGRAPLDAATLAACARHRDGLARLSAERVQAELAKMLAAADPAPALAAMRATGALAALLPLSPDAGRLARLIAAEAAAGVTMPDWRRRLAALLADGAADTTAERLKLSNEDRAYLAAITAAPLDPATAAVDVDAALYADGAAIVRDRALLRWSAASAPDTEAWRDLLARIGGYRHQPLPVGGADVLALGVAPGPAVGALLRDVTRLWIASGFSADRAALLDALARQAERQKH